MHRPPLLQDPTVSMSSVMQTDLPDRDTSPSPRMLTVCRHIQLTLLVAAVATYSYFTCELLLSAPITDAYDSRLYCLGDTCLVKCCALDQRLTPEVNSSCAALPPGVSRSTPSAFVASVLARLNGSSPDPDHFIVYNDCDSGIIPQHTVHWFRYNNTSLQKNNSMIINGQVVVDLNRVSCVDFNGVSMIIVGCVRGLEAREEAPPTRLVSTVSQLCSAASTLALIIVLMVYTYVHQFQSLHGQILLCYLISITLFHPVFIVTVVYLIDYAVFYNMTVCSMVAALTWLTVMCHEIWSKFSHPLRPRGRSPGTSSDRHKFIAYSLVGWGYPLSVSVLMIYFNDLKTSIFIDSLLLSVALNVTMLLSTLFNMRMFHGVPAAQSHAGLCLYLKLALLMGLDWNLFLICTLSDTTWVILLAFVLLECQGIFLFVFLVCNRRTLQSVRDRWQGQVGAVQQ